MAACFQNFWIPYLCLFIVFITCLITGSYEYDVTGFNRSSKDYVIEFVPLADISRSRRQVASNNLSTNKTKGGSGVSPPDSINNSGVNLKPNLKIEKNSSAFLSDPLLPPSSTVKKNLQQQQTLEEPLEDHLVQDLMNDSLPYRPKVIKDAHVYYNSTIFKEPERLNEFWVDLNKMGSEKVFTHDMLSSSYRKAATVTLSFDFPFYGHAIRNATIATGGFLYLGDFVHSWLASTQYIAPLMANFDTRISESSVIKYADNGTDFIVEWADTVLQDHEAAGPFTFQARLKNTGDIIFAYKHIPVSIASIPDSEHPVRIGVSDAYIIDRTLIYQKRKVIYEYHRVEIDSQHIENLTAVYLTALPSCNMIKDCDSCLSANIGFQCTWCPVAQRCSDGMDRRRHDWILLGCDAVLQAPEIMVCPVLPNNTYPDGAIHALEDVESRSFGPAGIIGILAVPLIVLGFGAWIVYAYKHPHSPSGQIIIKYRPSQWHLLKGDSDYTPASIHI